MRNKKNVELWINSSYTPKQYVQYVRWMYCVDFAYTWPIGMQLNELTTKRNNNNNKKPHRREKGENIHSTKRAYMLRIYINFSAPRFIFSHIMIGSTSPSPHRCHRHICGYMNNIQNHLLSKRQNQRWQIQMFDYYLWFTIPPHISSNIVFFILFFRVHVCVCVCLYAICIQHRRTTQNNRRKR